MSIFFTVSQEIDATADSIISWVDLTNGEYTPPASAFTEGTGTVRCGSTWVQK